jgi:hypothetical protein
MQMSQMHYLPIAPAFFAILVGIFFIVLILRSRWPYCASSARLNTTQTNATQFTTPFGSQTRQVRIVSTLPIWVTLDSTAVVTAASGSALIAANAVGEYFTVTPGQVLNFISTSTSTGYVSLTEMS